MKTIIPALVFLSITAVSCNKNRELNKLPPATQDGRNKFGALIASQAFVPGNTLFGNVQPVTAIYYKNARYMYRAGFLCIAGIDVSASQMAGQVAINKQNVFATGDYPLTDAAGYDFNMNYVADGISYYNEKTKKVYLAQSGKLSITKLDTVNFIVSGRFYFTGKDSTGQTIEVTDGRFDAKYYH